MRMKKTASTPQLPRWLTWLAPGSLALAVLVLLGLWLLSGGDLPDDMAVGQWIWQHRAIPRVDAFTFVTEGGPFVAHSWGAEILFYLIEQAAGTLGFMGLRFALISVAVILALRTAQLLNAPTSALILLAPVVLSVMWARLEFRPMLFTTVLLTVELWILVSVHTGRRSWRWLWVLPPAYAIWVNLHPGWPQGLAMLLAKLTTRLAMDLRGRSLQNSAEIDQGGYLPL